MYSVLNTLLEYTYKKTLLHTLFGLILKSPKAFSLSLSSQNLKFSSQFRIFPLKYTMKYDN